jgi:hypothetical protein
MKKTRNYKKLEMKFKLSMVKKFWNLDDERIKTYQELGFTFTIYESFGRKEFYLENSTSSKEIEFKTIEELLEFGKRHGRLVIERDLTIFIYNDYME